MPLNADLEDGYSAKGRQNGSFESPEDPSSNLVKRSRTTDAAASQNPIEPPRTNTTEQIEAPQVVQLSWQERIKHFSWTWFTLTMATGGLANVIHHGNLILSRHFYPVISVCSENVVYLKKVRARENQSDNF